MIEEDKIPPEIEDEKPVGEQGILISVIPPVTTAFIALIGIFLLYQLGGALLTIMIFGINIVKADVNAIRLFTVGGQFLLLLFPALLLAYYVYPGNTSYILRARFPSLKEIGLFMVGLIILTPLLQNFLAIQNFILQKIAAVSPFVKNITDMLDELDKLVEKTYGSLLTSHSIFESSFIIFVVAVVPALCEETLFRGLVQKSFEQRLKPVLSIIITAVFFGLYHFNPYGLIPLIALGAFFGFAAYISDSIFVPMALHFINNFIAVLAFLILGSDELLSAAAAKTDAIMPQLISFIIFGTFFFFYLFYLKNNYNRIVYKKEETI
ncbi:MAG: CPBP family intramembrane metalloprotease domain-containing protein [Ignavibacteriae bacterium HGW-Ignavibacteriae-3]|nr:MAG: CPBP family intramembrane metalloprotease domain-containing protein [Ignavibacteriae bacterium HGW-Ignavibacteriae-3]